MKNKSRRVATIQKTPAAKKTHRTPKQEGEVIELAFFHKAAEMGFGITKPYGDSEPYDFIVDSGSRLWRVQVKSTHTKFYSSHYYINTTHNPSQSQPYNPGQIDFLVVHTAPDLAWYVIPVCALAERRAIYLFPHRKGGVGQYECFREAWCLMACRRDPKVRPGISVDPLCGPCASCQSGCLCPLLRKKGAGSCSSKKKD